MKERCDPIRADCQDKDSAHYLMCHMMQEEFMERFIEAENIPPFEFNMIRKKFLPELQEMLKDKKGESCVFMKQ